MHFLDQREHVPHAEDPRRHPFRVEHLSLFYFFRDAGELDRCTGHVAQKRGTAPRDAVELGEHDAGERQRIRNARAVFTASWPCIASTMNSVSIGATAACSDADLRHHRFVDRGRPAVSTITTS